MVKNSRFMSLIGFDDIDIFPASFPNPPTPRLRGSHSGNEAHMHFKLNVIWL